MQLDCRAYPASVAAKNQHFWKEVVKEIGRVGSPDDAPCESQWPGFSGSSADFAHQVKQRLNSVCWLLAGLRLEWLLGLTFTRELCGGCA